MINATLNILEYGSLLFLAVLMFVVALFGVIYAVDIIWNFVRAISDPAKGFKYYFSKNGPAN